MDLGLQSSGCKQLNCMAPEGIQRPTFHIKYMGNRKMAKKQEESESGGYEATSICATKLDLCANNSKFVLIICYRCWFSSAFVSSLALSSYDPCCSSLLGLQFRLQFMVLGCGEGAAPRV